MGGKYIAIGVNDLERRITFKKIGFNHQEMRFNHQEMMFNHKEMTFNHEEMVFNHKEMVFNHKEMTFNYEEMRFNHEEMRIHDEEMMCNMKKMAFYPCKENNGRGKMRKMRKIKMRKPKGFLVDFFTCICRRRMVALCRRYT